MKEEIIFICEEQRGCDCLEKIYFKKLSKETYYFIPFHYGDHLPVLVGEQGVSSVGSSFNPEASPDI